MPGTKPLVMVGASRAALQLAATARQLGFDEPMVASALRTRGVEVTVIEAQPQLADTSFDLKTAT
jgi:hypothetical protein